MTTAAAAETARESTTQFILAKNIDWVKVDSSERVFDKNFAAQLSISIKHDGLLNPVTVRPNQSSPGRYIGIAGKHRWFASHKILKYDLIEAKVVEATDHQARVKSISENLMRNPLGKTQMATAIKVWHDAYTEESVAFESQKAERAAKRVADKAARKDAGSKLDPAEVAADDPEPVAPVSNFAADVAAKTGVSETTVKRSLAIAKAFDAEQLEVLEQCGVNQTWTETIARIADKAQRDAVVNLVASGRSPEESIAEVTGKSEIKTASGLTKDLTATREDTELSDEEWVHFHCAGVIATLPLPQAFQADAILYRQTTGHRAHLKGKVRPMLDDAKKAGATAGLYGVMVRLVSMSHPKHWLRCAKCLGNCVAPGETTRCPKCFGCGYTTTTERF